MTMPDSGSTPNKSFARQVNAFTGSDAWEQLEASGRDILSVDQDYEANDVAAALNNRVMLDGGNINASIPLNTNIFTGVGNATARTHFAAAGQVQDNSLAYAGESSGTDTITATLSPSITAYVAGQIFAFRAGGTNTGAATLNVNSVGAADIKKGPAGTTDLAAGDITDGGMYLVSYNGETEDFELLNPGTQNVPITTAGAALLDDASASDQRTTLGLGSLATLSSVNNSNWSGTDLAVENGGTGASSAAAARTNLGAILTDAVFPGAIIAIIEDQKSSGTDGGTFTSGADRTRTLNTLVYNRNTTVSLSSDQFTLPAGTWMIRWFAPIGGSDSAVGLHQSLLYDVTNTTEIARGTQGSSDGGDFANGHADSSVGSAVVSPAGSTAYEIRHRCQTSQSTTGFGQAASFGTEVYSRVEIYAA